MFVPLPVFMISAQLTSELTDTTHTHTHVPSWSYFASPSLSLSLCVLVLAQTPRSHPRSRSRCGSQSKLPHRHFHSHMHPRARSQRHATLNHTHCCSCTAAFLRVWGHFKPPQSCLEGIPAGEGGCRGPPSSRAVESEPRWADIRRCGGQATQAEAAIVDRLRHAAPRASQVAKCVPSASGSIGERLCDQPACPSQDRTCVSGRTCALDSLLGSSVRGGGAHDARRPRRALWPSIAIVAIERRFASAS